MTDHTPLHKLEEAGDVETGGRLRAESGDWLLANAHVEVPLVVDDDAASAWSDGALARVRGEWDGTALHVDVHRLLHQPQAPSSLARPESGPSLADAIDGRAELLAGIRRHFDDAEFREVETPNAVAAPGTDIYLEPVGTRSPENRDAQTVPPYLHTSPEFAMKRLLTEGFERIYQIAKVWRDGERTDLHNPEFTLLEWYRAWEPLEATMGDCEQLVRRACGGRAVVAANLREEGDETTVDLDPPFERLTMQELVGRAAGFDILEALDYESLRREIVDRDLLVGDVDRRHPPDEGRWDELFFELQVAVLEPHLADRGAVFVTDWPAPLAILARKSEDDPRVARRFELFVGGIELANGFDELTDPDEQRRRFEEERDDRRKMGRPALPMPERFLRALDYGLPPASGVALGVDRLLMLALGASSIDEVLPLRGDLD